MSYQKNTNIPNPESHLWDFGDNWKIPASGIPYTKLDDLSNNILYNELCSIVENGNKDVKEYDGYHLACRITDEDNVLVYAHPSHDSADSQLNYKGKSGGGSTNNNNNRGGGGNRQQQSSNNNNNNSGAPRRRPIIGGSGGNNNNKNIEPRTVVTASEVKAQIYTFTDITPVNAYDQQAQTQKIEEGLIQIPAILLSPNFYFDGDGNPTILMGKIINAPISE